MSPRRTSKPRKADTRAGGKYLNALRQGRKNLRIKPIDDALMRAHEQIMTHPGTLTWDPADPPPANPRSGA